MSSLDEFFMRQALKEAQKAFDADEVPVGAVIVSNDRVIARAHNQVELLKDATAHAEMLAITTASASIGDWRLLDATLYTSLEPCAMCAGAILLSRIKRLVWAAKDLRCGANGTWVDLFSIDHPFHKTEVVGSVLEAEAAELMRSFFQKKRS